MTAAMLISSKEALETLGLAKPGEKVQDKLRYLKWLNQRGLLVGRYKISGREYKYDKAECERLLNRALTEGIILTLNPNKQAA